MGTTIAKLPSPSEEGMGRQSPMKPWSELQVATAAPGQNAPSCAKGGTSFWEVPAISSELAYERHSNSESEMFQASFCQSF